MSGIDSDTASEYREAARDRDRVNDRVRDRVRDRERVTEYVGADITAGRTRHPVGMAADAQGTLSQSQASRHRRPTDSSSVQPARRQGQECYSDRVRIAGQSYGALSASETRVQAGAATSATSAADDDLRLAIELSLAEAESHSNGRRRPVATDPSLSLSLSPTSRRTFSSQVSHPGPLLAHLAH